MSGQNLPLVRATMLANIGKRRAIEPLRVVVVIADITNPVRGHIFHRVKIEKPLIRIIVSNVSHFVKQYVICMYSILYRPIRPF